MHCEHRSNAGSAAPGRVLDATLSFPSCRITRATTPIMAPGSRLQAIAIGFALHLLLVSSDPLANAPTDPESNSTAPLPGASSQSTATTLNAAASTNAGASSATYQDLSESALLSRQALEDVVASVQKYGIEASTFFSEQVTRATTVANEVSSMLSATVLLCFIGFGPTGAPW